MRNNEAKRGVHLAGESSGVVFDIQRYSIHDGPGIRTTVFLKGCPLTCAWCQNPESQSRQPEILLNSANCTKCGRCIEACPAEANSLLGGCVEIHRQKCIHCGKCVEACPNEARRISGNVMDVDEVLEEVMKDLKFYETSGGGITLSGGEATFQPDFAHAILKRSKDLGLHTVLETCGYTSWTVFERLLDHTDLVLFDIKHINAEKHKRGTGVSNERILSNAGKIAQRKPMRVRVPLIPAFNDSEQDVRDIAAFAGSLPNQVEVDLLPYNPLGEGKYERLGKEGVPHLEVQTDAYIETLRSIVSKETNKSKLNVVHS